MLFTTLLATAAFATTAVASPVAVPHTVHEKRGVLPTGWQKRDALDRNTILPMKIALAQSNLDRGWEWLKEVSHPYSEKFGQHWSAKEVAEAFAPR
jgi:tripeptidyl-peptidase I